MASVITDEAVHIKKVASDEYTKETQYGKYITRNNMLG